MTRLRTVVATSSVRLLAMPDAETTRRPGPNKWSSKEVIGHLIDSALVNHDRFLRAQFKDDLVFPGYDQDAWVAAQRYADADWPELVRLWAGLNRHIGRLMLAVPESIRMRRVARHNLDVIAWHLVPQDQETSLDYLMADYVGHLEHHLEQILTSHS